MTCSLSTPATAALLGRSLLRQCAECSASAARDREQDRRKSARGIREVEKHAILGASPRDLDVYELTLRGIARKHQFNGDATRAGRADLEEAIRRDPNYAPAHAYLAWLNLIDSLMGLTGEWGPSRLGDAIGQFNRAIELDSSLSTAHQGLSQALIHSGDLGQAVAVVQRGVELGPSDADALLFLAVALFEAGEVTEALELADKAIGLNPLRPAYYCFFHALILWGNERYQQALGEEEECLRKAPAFGGAHTYRVMCLVGLGHLDEARKLLAQLMAKSPVSGPPSKAAGACQPRAGSAASRGLASYDCRGAGGGLRRAPRTFSEIFSSLS